MATAGDLGLEQTLENLKLKDNEYLQNQTPQTEANLSEAMSRQASALADSGGMVKQSEEMRMMKQDFERTTDKGRKFNIALKLAKSLVRMSAKKLKGWTILSTVSAAGLACALYDIHANGDVVARGDTTGDGLNDTTHVDTNHDMVPDYELQDTDANGLVDRIAEMGENGEVGDVVGEGRVLESVFEGLEIGGNGEVADVVGEGGVLGSVFEGLEIGGNGEVAEVVVEGGVVESLIEGLGNMLGLFG